MKQSQQYLVPKLWLDVASDTKAHDWYTEKTDPVLHFKCRGKEDGHPLDSDDVKPAGDGRYFVTRHAKSGLGNER